MVLKHWKNIALAVLLLVGVGMCKARDRAIAERALTTERLARSDSLLRVMAVQSRAAVQHTDTVIRTVRAGVDRYFRDTLWRTDTVTVRDTLRVLVPIGVVQRTDSTLRACSLLTTTCEQERVAHEREKRELKTQNSALKSQIQKRNWTERAITFTAGVVLGGVLQSSR